MHAIGSNKGESRSKQHRFNLSTFLSILDGHTLEEGIIFIMTTNHSEILDPAVIRSGKYFSTLPLFLDRKMESYLNFNGYVYGFCCANINNN